MRCTSLVTIQPAGNISGQNRIYRRKRKVHAVGFGNLGNETLDMFLSLLLFSVEHAMHADCLSRGYNANRRSGRMSLVNLTKIAWITTAVLLFQP